MAQKLVSLLLLLLAKDTFESLNVLPGAVLSNLCRAEVECDDADEG